MVTSSKGCDQYGLSVLGTFVKPSWVPRNTPLALRSRAQIWLVGIGPCIPSTELQSCCLQCDSPALLTF